MSEFDDNEASVAQNRPIDLYDIVTPTVTYRVTPHPVDVIWQGNTYTAIPMSRGPQQVTQDQTGRELLVQLPISHPLVQRFVATGIPERQVLITLRRLQDASGIAVQAWQGFGVGMQISGRIAKLRVPSITDDAMKVKLPVFAASQLCNHRLFDRLCSPSPGVDGPDPANFQVACTAVSQEPSPAGTVLTVSSMANLEDGWATLGQILHVRSDERRFIVAHEKTALTITASFVGLAPGEPLVVFAGCSHTIFTCRDKFSNVVNYGGHPNMASTINPWAVKGIGVIRQE